MEVSSIFGTAMAVIVTASFTPSQNSSKAVFLDHIIIQDPAKVQTTIWCRSWVAPTQGQRIFFTNEVRPRMIVANERFVSEGHQRTLCPWQLHKLIADCFIMARHWFVHAGMQTK